MRRVAVISGIRSEFFFMKPLFEAINHHVDLELELYIAGANLSPIHGNMIEIIQSGGFKIAGRIENLLYSDSASSRLSALALELQIFTSMISSDPPDIIIATGDREEAMVSALAGTYLNIPVFHYAAGDVGMGTADDTIRHSVSKLAHLMLTITSDSADNLIQSGEEAWRIHNVGHLGQDRYRTTDIIGENELRHKLGIKGDGKIALVLQHPLTVDVDNAGHQMEAVLKGVSKFGFETVVIHPNSDPGTHQMKKVIREWEKQRKILSFETLDDLTFVNLLRNTFLLVGNSSMGILEVPALKIPVINTGLRQTGRSITGHVKYVDCNESAIHDAIELLLNNSDILDEMRNSPNPYGDGYATEKIIKLILETPLDERLMQKRYTFSG
ncbi:MAG: UDP-N-acetylglucosamine 2-epimerase (hydrolyzing) [Deltaproteobacteria bacterium]|nr:UDP-N-acetylglucosamine 2-epimerase (hydrolyzing) [Deltaproteobacteria bacterium]